MAEYFNYFGFVMFSKIKAVTDDLIERDPVGALEVLFSVVRQRDTQSLAALDTNIQSNAVIKGRTNNVKTAKGTKLATVFALVYASEVIASHTATGALNPKYPQELQPRDRGRDTSVAWVSKTANDLDPDSLGKTRRVDTGSPIVGDDLVVESGNGRTMAIQLAYERGTAEEYREWLIEEAEYFGFKPEQVEAFDKPMLVRVRTTAIDREQFAIEANQDDKLSLTATERAKTDAKRIDDNMMMLFAPNENGDLMSSSNIKFLSAFMAKLGDSETAQYLDKSGQFTQSFVTRVKQAIFAKAYNDDRLLEMMADQSKPELQNMINALTIASPKFIKAKAVVQALLGGELSTRVEHRFNDRLIQRLEIMYREYNRRQRSVMVR